MSHTRGLAAPHPTAALEPFAFDRRAPGPHDVALDILFCGICHSDIHQVRNEWQNSRYPMVPGHEIVGRVRAVGAKVTRHAVGDLAGVGCMVNACRACDPCSAGHEQFCANGCAMTYNSTEMDRTTATQGGYSEHIVVDENFVLKVAAKLDPAGTAPLLCAGITTYSPLRRLNTGPGHKVAVLGLGGLGHMAVKLAAAMGAEVTVLSTSAHKEADARRLGAHAFALTSEKGASKRLAARFDTLIDTASADHDLVQYLGYLRVGGTHVLLGIPPKPATLAAGALVMGNKTLTGSLIGGIAETQQMLDFCAEHAVVADVEVIAAKEVNRAFERVLKSDVKYRFSIDIATL